MVNIKRIYKYEVWKIEFTFSKKLNILLKLTPKSVVPSYKKMPAYVLEKDKYILMKL